ncbi:MAG TPA: hypothetical protein VHK69_15615 [Chitinophagaceae bacterium]|jgi:hypothetical protein|nr:hypothetical protein [Chitinophagaceae bacterium]
MIPAIYLRIGNRVRHRESGQTGTVTALLPEGVHLSGNTIRTVPYGELEGIALTDRLLETCGFAADAFGYASEDLSLNRYETVYHLRLPGGTGYGRAVRYLHELENLYLQLTGNLLP